MVGKLSEIKKIMKILRENGVEEYKNGEFYVKLSARAYLSQPMIEISKFETEKTKTKQEQEDDDLFYSGA